MELTPDKFLSVTEVDELVAHLRQRMAGARGDRLASARLDEVIVKALLFSGLRNSEFCGLKVSDTIVGTGQSVFVVRGRAARARTVYVPQTLSALVQDYVRDVRPGSLPAEISRTDAAQPLVLNERGRAYERTGLYRRVVRILTEAGLGTRASVQLLRHTYGHLAYLRTGGNLLFVQRQLGHAHPRITSVYAKFVDESYVELADGIAVEAGQRVVSGRATHAGRASNFDCDID